MQEGCFEILATYSEEDNILELFYHLSPEICKINSVLLYPSPTNVVSFLQPVNWKRGLFCGRDSFSFDDSPLQKSSAHELSDMMLLISGEKNTMSEIMKLCETNVEVCRSIPFESFGRLYRTHHDPRLLIFAGKMFFLT